MAKKILFYFLIFSICNSCVKKQENLSNNHVEKNSTLIPDKEILINNNRDLLNLNTLIDNNENSLKIMEHVDSSVEEQLTDMYGVEFTNNKMEIYDEMFKLRRLFQDSIGGIPKYSIKKSKILLKDKNLVVTSAIGKIDYMKNNKIVFTMDNVTIGISENSGRNFKFINVMDVEKARKTLSYKLSENQINSMKVFKIKSK